VAIYKLLQKSAFGPDQIKIMTDAYEITLKTLRLVDRTDPVTHIIARRSSKSRKPTSVIRRVFRR
jgi:hypothetical protein